MDLQPGQAGNVAGGIEIDLDRRQLLQPRAVGHLGGDAVPGLFHLAVPADLVVGEQEELPLLDFGAEGGIAFGNGFDVGPGGILGDREGLGGKRRGEKAKGQNQGKQTHREPGQ